MTEEEIKALQEKLAAQESALEEVQKERDKYKQDVTGVVDELKEVRAKKQEAETALEKLQGNTGGQPDNSQVDINEQINQALREREAEQAKRSREEAIEEFKNSKTEFKSDDTGMVFEGFKREMNKFNFEGLNSKEAIKARLEEVYRFTKGTEKPGDDTPAYEGTPSGGGSTPPAGDEDPQMSRLSETIGMDKDRITKLKSKYGEAVSNLGV